MMEPNPHEPAITANIDRHLPTDLAMTNTPLRIGIAGLGRAFSIMLPTFLHDPRVQLVAAADPIATARARFVSDFGAPAYDSVEAVCADPRVQVVYVATPHQFHSQHRVIVEGQTPWPVVVDQRSSDGAERVLIDTTNAFVQLGPFGDIRLRPCLIHQFPDIWQVLLP